MPGTPSPESRCTGTAGKRVIASSPILTVEACACGVVHLHFGPMSLRFTACSLDVLTRTLHEARERLELPEGSAPLLGVHQGGPRGIA